MSVKFDFDLRGVDRSVKQVSKRLNKAAKDLQRANASAINDTLKQLRTQVRKELKTHITAKSSYLNRRMWTKKAEPSRAVGHLHFGTRFNVPLRAFAKRQGRQGVSVQVMKGGRRTIYKSSFMLKGQRQKKSGGTQNYDIGVFRRTGKKRLPLERVQGINVAGILKRSGIFPRLRKKAPSMLRKNIVRRHNLIALRNARKVAS